MSALVFSLQEQQVVVVMDTLATVPGTCEPYFFTTKAYPMPHLGGLICATGIGELLDDWFLKLNHFIARDIHHLDQFVTPVLSKTAERFGFNEFFTSTIYHFGFSEVEQRYVGFAYRSTSSFQSERLKYGLGVKPPIYNVQVESIEDFVTIVERQRSEEEKRPIEERIFIGGEVQAFILQDRTINISTLARFPDFEETYQAMLKHVK